VLYVGAHPDDEENGLVALLSRGHGARVVYWSATRGEGGQSRICPYRGDELGVYRTWESLDAREVDGGESLFGPFVDYDFSKGGAEALQKWGEDRLVRELVRAIRTVQPQLLISRWRGDASDGHGHHTAVGTAVKEAFAAAGDPARFADLEQVGLAPWQPRKLYQSMMGDYQPGESVELGIRRPDLERAGCLPVNTGGFDPIARLTYQEQGARALNEHLTQGYGNVPAPGDYFVYLRLAQTAPGSDLDGSLGLYEGFDATLTGLAGYPGEEAVELRDGLAALKELAAAAAAGFRVEEPWRVSAELLELVRRHGELEARLGGLGLTAVSQRALARALERKRLDAAAVAAGCLGLRLQADLDRAELTPGQSVRVACRLWSYGPEAPTEVEFAPRANLEGAVVRRVDASNDPPGAEFEIVVPTDAELTSPYWLRAPHGEYAYAWEEIPGAGRPWDQPLIEVTCALRIGGEDLELTGPALRSEPFAGGFRELEPSILPPIAAEAAAARHILRARDVPQVLELKLGVLAHDEDRPIAGVVEVRVPEGWTAEPDRADVTLAKAGDVESIPVRVTIPERPPPGTHEIQYGVRCRGRLYEASTTAVMAIGPGLGMEPDEGTCMRRQFIAKPSLVTVDLIDVEVHDEHAHGYVTGMGDQTPGLLRGLGLSVDELTDDDLVYASLDAYDTIVIGPNAFVVRDALQKSAQRLLAYVHDGGTLVVQYQGFAHERMGAAPFPFRYSQPHDRITTEESPVRIVRPDHFLFQYPNRIDASDFSGWVRDRGMYFFGEWDEGYEPLLACADPGEDEKLGGLLLAAYGRGLYAYCGYTLFRQLPAGVRGAHRLFSNLLALPEARTRRRMEHLREIPLLARLGDAQLHRVAQIATDRRLADGEYLFREGDEGAELFVIEAGALDVLRGQPEELVGTCMPGEPIGELAAFTGLPRKTSLRARGATQLFSVRADDFFALLRDEPDFSEYMLRLLARRLSSALTPSQADGSSLVAPY
jgi:LmbE family N-acetylglucosaminyl deacetylase